MDKSTDNDNYEDNDNDNEDFSDVTDRKVRTESKDFSIREFRTMYEEGELILNLLRE